MLEALERAFSIPELKRRIIFVLMMLLIFAVGAHIPVPGVGQKVIEAYLNQRGGGAGILNLIDTFSGGSLRRMSMFALGIQPYINSSIIMQMMTMAIPQLDALQKEGESGRKQIAKITRNLTVILAVVQSFGITLALKHTTAGHEITFVKQITIAVALTAGTSFLLWLGEQVTQKGIGNGISLIIFAGIMLSLRSQASLILQQIHAGTPWINLVVLLAFFVGTTYLIVMITQGTRRIPIQHTKRVIGMRQTQAGASFLPIKVNTAGVIPIIFAMSLMPLPATIASLIPGNTLEGLKSFLGKLRPGDNPFATGFYALMVIVFTYFYTAVVMNVQEMADNLRKYGNYIPGIRPGKPTYEYLERVISRITLAGAVFLAIIAVLQYIVPTATGFQSFTLVGGTSLLIIVGVAIETMQAIEAQLLMRNYEGFIKSDRQ